MKYLPLIFLLTACIPEPPKDPVKRCIQECSFSCLVFELPVCDCENHCKDEK